MCSVLIFYFNKQTAGYQNEIMNFWVVLTANNNKKEVEQKVTYFEEQKVKINHCNNYGIIAINYAIRFHVYILDNPGLIYWSVFIAKLVFSFVITYFSSSFFAMRT